jgi:hypothetical protein
VRSTPAVGVAVYHAQVLEAGVVNYLLLERARRRRRGQSFDVDQVFEHPFGNHLGQNLKELRDVLGDDWPLAQQLLRALNLRNDLVHHYMRTHILKFGSAEARAEMIAELLNMEEELQSADTALRVHAEPLRAKAGITAEWIQDEYKRLTAISKQPPDEQPEVSGPGW